MPPPRTPLELLFDALGDEIWRQYVDLDRQHYGPMVYDRGLGRSTLEPGYLQSMADGHAFARENLGVRVTSVFCEVLQDLVMGHAPPARRYRPGECWVHVRRERIEPGLEGVWQACGAQADPPASAAAPRVRLRFLVPTGTLKQHVDAHLDAYYAQVAAATDPGARLSAIATLHQRLELLHPTEDGNTRRHAVLLDKLLVEQGFCPVILTEPNDVYARGPESWTLMVEQGMQRWRVARAAVDWGEDVAAELRRYDATGPLGSAGCALQPDAPEPAYDAWLSFDE